VGIDLGGTNIRAVACDKGSSNISDILKEPLERKESVILEVDNNLIKLIDRICFEKQKEGKELGGIGIAMAALFNRKTGVVTKWPNNSKWNNFPIREYLVKHYLVPVVLEDDANAAALGERLAGAGMGFKDFVYVTVSTGIGSGIVVNDSLLIGCHGWAGEMGHIRVSEEEVTCTCGAKGCLQAMASGPAILEGFKKTKAYEKYYDNQNIDLKDVVSLAQEGIKEAADVFREAGGYIGKALANYVMLLDVPVIILGGGVIEAGDLIMKPILEGFKKFLQDKRNVNIVCSSLNDKNGVMGALSLIDKHVNDKNTIVLT